MSNDSLKDSAWVQALAKSLVQTFMANSALPLAAAVSDASNNLRLLEESSSSSATSTSKSSSLKNANPNDNPILALWKEQEQNQKTNPAALSSPSFPLTELFAATSFELRQPPIFAKDGHVWLPCVANLPYDTSNKSQLDFTLRTKPKVSASSAFQHQEEGLEFSAAECSLNVDATQTPEWAKQFLPSIVWLPIGSAGMILPMPITRNKIHQLKRLTIREDACQIQGELDLFRTSSRNKKGEGFGKTFGKMLQSFRKPKKNGDAADQPKLQGGK